MRFLVRAAAVMVGIAAGVGTGATAANADTGAAAVSIGSPGALSGNVIQVPVDVPVNVCGNTVDIIAIFNPTLGNTCVNASAHSSSDSHQFRAGFRNGTSVTAANTRERPQDVARGNAAIDAGSPRGLSIPAPINVPINFCGNTVDIIAALNPAFGNTCARVSARSSSDGHHFSAGFRSGR